MIKGYGSNGGHPQEGRGWEVQAAHKAQADQQARPLDKCRELPTAKAPAAEDFITQLFVTVLDFRLTTQTVEHALDYYRTNRA